MLRRKENVVSETNEVRLAFIITRARVGIMHMRVYAYAGVVLGFF